MIMKPDLLQLLSNSASCSDCETQWGVGDGGGGVQRGGGVAEGRRGREGVGRKEAQSQHKEFVLAGWWWGWWCLTHAVTGLNIDLTSRPYF